MDLDKLPARSLRKLRKDGLKELIQESWDVLVQDFFLYRTVYRQFLEENIEILTREAIYEQGDHNILDEFNGQMRSKGPDGFRALDEPREYTCGDRFVCEFANATLLGPVGPGLTEQGIVIADTVGTPPLVPRRTGVSIAQSMTANGIRPTLNALQGDASPNQRIGTATLAASPWSNYYHWTVECLLRAQLLEKYGDETGTYPTLLVPEHRSSWMDESLELLNYSGDVVGLGKDVYQVETLVVPTFPDPIPQECLWIRDRMKSSLETTDHSDHRIFVAREDATVRRIANRDAVQPVLDRYDIDTYLLGELSVREQVELFSGAELVVGPHGAGLTNILYGDDLTVVELFGDKTMATFDRLAENMNHDYRYLQCEQAGLDIRVNVDDLDDMLRDILNT
ncbi:glycosyltransferase family 61 protein [Halobacterium salinarum]|uniref:glycosyltransferase family 61 protein n=1 Tax=Halobacterium salinarum TaxID=2242 RepID=UPI00255677C0|nr:glycosyltransferase family 61 protein [Halobacterium salinarum]MDL0131967.1 glycosyltransferase family 61 protein [Halobacterium salinarum]